MTAIDIDQVAKPEPKRDRYGRYLINNTAHTRATTITKTLSDSYGLEQWKMRMVAHGIGARPDLQALAATTNPETGKQALNRLCQDAMDYAQASSGANLGTALHSATEHVDRGNPPHDLPGDLNKRVELYTKTLAENGVRIDRKRIEQIVTIRDWNGDRTAPPIAGTLDRIVTLADGRKIVADLKTGANLDYSWQEISMQIAIYANHDKTYDPVKDKQHPAIKGLNKDVGLIIHLPSKGDITCDLYLVDLAAGVEAVDYALWVRGWRKRSGLSEVYRPAKTPPTVDRQDQPDATWLRYRITEAAANPDAIRLLRQLWPAGIPQPLPQTLDTGSVETFAAVLDVIEDRYELPLHPFTNRPGTATPTSTSTNKNGKLL